MLSIRLDKTKIEAAHLDVGQVIGALRKSPLYRMF